MAAEKASGSGEKAIYRFTPLPARGVIAGEFTGPRPRQVLRWARQEGELLTRVSSPNLLVEFERFRRGVSANVEHDEIVDMGLPQKSRSGDLFSFMHLDRVSSQDGGTYLARSLAGVDEGELSCPQEPDDHEVAVGHTQDTPETSAPFLEGDSCKVCAEKEREVKRKAVHYGGCSTG
jgi:hypothetical protein